MLAELSHPGPQDASDSFWRSLRYFSYYRCAVACLFLAAIPLSDAAIYFGAPNPRLFLRLGIVYLIGALFFTAGVIRWRRAFDLQLTLQVIFDIVVLTFLLHAGGGAKSGIAMMILVVLVGAGLVGQGRMVLFYAALATLALMLEHAFRVIQLSGELADFFHVGLTSLGFFGSAIAARLLARRVIANEDLARRRGIQLADQLRINERVIRDMQDGVLVVDTTGRIRQANPQAAALLGLSPPPFPALGTGSPALAREFFARHERGVESVFVLQVAQSGRTLRVRMLPPGEGGNALIYLEDTERLQQQAQQLKLAALGRLTANMAHEIRNPLSAVNHAAELLSDVAPSPDTERLTRIIVDNARRLNRLVQEIMEVGRRDRVALEQILLRRFLSQLVDEYILQAPENTRRLNLDVPEAATVCFDRSHLHRVLANLIDNALRFASKEGGAVRILCEPGETPERIALHVIDDGPGIGEHERVQVFEPFFTTRMTGTGLGLYIARELSEANGARLSLLDNSPGAHFCLSCAMNCNPESQ